MADNNVSNSKAYLEAHRATAPLMVAENSNTPQRCSLRGESYEVAVFGSKMTALVDEGSYFLATNPTPGTGIATIAAQATFADTAPFILLTNTNATTTNIRIYLDYLRLQCTAAGTNGTNISCAVKTDTSITRYTSGGSVITPVCPNQDSSGTTKAVIQCGALVAAAATGSARLLGSALLRTVIPVVGDVYLVNFGPDVKGLNGGPVGGTLVANVEYDTCPVIIGPQECVAIHIWLASQSAASSYTFELGYFER